MMTNKHRVKAFTIMEVTISMLIAAIVIGITYTAYGIISQSFMGFKKKNDAIAVLNRVDQLMKRDFEQATIIVGSGNAIRIDKEHRTSVRYEINPGYMIRNSDGIDTFKVATQGLKLSFEGKTDSLNESESIDELSFTLNFNEESIPCHYHKNYSSFNLMNIKNTDAFH